MWMTRIIRGCEVCLAVIAVLVFASGVEWKWFAALGPPEEEVVSMLLDASALYHSEHDAEGFYTAANQFKHRTRLQSIICGGLVFFSSACWVMLVLRRWSFTHSSESIGQEGVCSLPKRTLLSQVGNGAPFGSLFLIFATGLYVFGLIQPMHTSAIASDFIRTSKTHSADQQPEAFAKQVRYYNSVPFSPPIPYRVGGLLILLSGTCLAVEWVNRRRWTCSSRAEDRQPAP